MKWTVFLALTLFGFVAGNGAWKKNQVYKYKLVTKLFLKESMLEQGAIGSFWITIRPQSDNLLIGQITQVEYNGPMSSEEQDSNMSKGSSELEDFPLNVPFIINLENGVIHSLSVERNMTDDQIIPLKFIVSQFQLDTKAQNVIASEGNHLPDKTTDNAYYATMESTVNGQCETTYDISRLPEYLAYANRESIPLPELVGEGDVIQIVKNNNYKNCDEATLNLLFLASLFEDTSRMDSNLADSLNIRIFVTGSLDDYTIQSSVSTNKLGRLSEYNYLTLESMEQSNADWAVPQSENMKNVGIAYTIDSKKNGMKLDETENQMFVREKVSSSEEKWNGRSNRGCEMTKCSSILFEKDQLCTREFGDRLPITEDTSVDCPRGLWQARCCPKL